jgi:signal transduction histidine kinase
MKLRTKTFLMVALISVLIFIALQAITLSLIQPSFINLEKQETEAKIKQAKNILNYTLTNLEVKATDYAFWDDSYRFIQDQNYQYINSNFVDSTFENLDLDLVAIIGNGRLLFCQSYDHLNFVKVSSPEEVQNFLMTDEYIHDFPSLETPVSGLIAVGNRPMMIASVQILTSDIQGPAFGEMIFGKYLDNEAISNLAHLADFHLSIICLTEFQNAQLLSPTLTPLTKDSISLKPNGEDSISGFTLIKDIHGNPTLVLEIVQGRAVYLQSILVGNIFLVAALVLSFSFGLLILVLIEREIVKPMTKLANYVEGLSLNSNVRPPLTLKNAAEELTVVTKAVENTLKTRLEGMNEVATMVAHDLRNPLAGIKNISYLLNKKHGSQMGTEGTALLQKIDDCVVYSNKIVQNLLDYSTDIKLDKTRISAKAIVDIALKKFVLPSNISLVNEVDSNLFVNVDIDKIERVFTNLIANAIDAMHDGGTLTVKSKKQRGNIELDFCDTGIGMSEQVLEKLWTPFFTTKAKGMGIGLSICKRVIDTHGGRIDVRSTEGNGACFQILLPVA